MNETRIQKVISDAGLCSRREAERAIENGEVTVNGRPAKIGQKVTSRDIIVFRGTRVDGKEGKEYYMLNKPVGYVTTMSEQFGRKSVNDLLGDIKARVYPVGRLDMDSEGLLLLTNDGDLTMKLTHPRYHIPKTYIVRVKGDANDVRLAKLLDMRELDGEPIAPVKITLIDYRPESSLFKFILQEGKNRQIRRMCESCGLTVTSLKRIAVGDLKLEGLKSGQVRALNSKEIKYLKDKTKNASSNTNPRNRKKD